MPIPFLQNAHEPVDLVCEVARLLWRSQGGTPFWVLPAYETDWCASLGVFHDLRRQLELTCGAAADKIQPVTPIRSLIERPQESGLLYTLERTFGVWLGQRPKEGCLPLLIAGITASPLGWFAGTPLILALDGSGVVLVLWMITCWIIAGAIYVRSQPRLPAHVRTIKDLVREIVHRRSAQGATQKRIRPPAVACRS